MRGLLLCVVVGCGYHPQVAAVATDGPPPGDGNDPPADTPTTAACGVAISGAEVAAPIIGGTGGTDRAPATCAAGELPIGLGYDVTQNPLSNHANQVAMVHLHLRCGRIARGTDGVFSTTPMEVFDSTGGVGGNCAPYFPTVVATEVLCPAGSVLVGVGGNRLDDTLYNTVSITCRALGPDGTPTGSRVTLTIANTGTETNQPMTSACDEGTAISSFGIKSGCGHDQLAPRCAPISCI